MGADVDQEGAVRTFLFAAANRRVCRFQSIFLLAPAETAHSSHMTLRERAFFLLR